jgi:hypothetical protein
MDAQPMRRTVNANVEAVRRWRAGGIGEKYEGTMVVGRATRKSWRPLIFADIR